MKARSNGASNRLKSLYCLFFTVAAAVLFGGDAAAVAPLTDYQGVYYDYVQIMKGNMPDISGVFQLKYSGDYQDFLGLKNNYKGNGTIFYKLGDSGTWSGEAPKLKSVGLHDVYYYVVGDSNYIDLGSPAAPKHVVVSVVDWGQKVNQGEIVNYVDRNGKTSAEVNKNGIIWLKEESDGSSAWYGLDNSNGTFKDGSRFWVRWLSSSADQKEFSGYYDQLDDAHKKAAEHGKTWIFLTGVTDLNGKEYTNFEGEIDFYIELGTDWSKDDINAVFITEGADEVLKVTFLEFFNSPAGNKTFAKIRLSHFSPYAIYDKGAAGKGKENAKSKAQTSSSVGSECLKGSVDDSINKPKGIYVPEKKPEEKEKPYEVSPDSLKILLLEAIIVTASIATIISIIKLILLMKRRKEKQEEN